jgi:hypothetical protein
MAKQAAQAEQEEMNFLRVTFDVFPGEKECFGMLFDLK